MATFSIDAFTTDTVTVTASGLISGSVICFLIYLTGDESAVIVKEEYTSTGDSITETFEGLDPSTDYTVNVHDGTDWLGALEFTTETKIVVDSSGRLLNIPVLSADYPLFDWRDWPDSYAALVPDGPTSEFEKECWNAIVDKLAEAFETAGIPWNNAYTTYEGTRITEEYGDLYAKMMNSLRHNIDHPAPLGGWNWACDSSFRGYIGREDFRGVDVYGEQDADDVYPEYFKELVRKLNLLLEIMRCNGHIHLIQTGENIDTTAYNRPRSRQGSPLGCYGSSYAWHHNKAIRVAPAALIVVDPYSTYTLSFRNFLAGHGGRLIVDPYGTGTQSLNLMRSGIPVYLKTDKKLIMTENMSGFRPGQGFPLVLLENVLIRNTYAFRSGISAGLQYRMPVLTSEYAAGRAGVPAPLQYSTPVFTLEHVYSRAGTSVPLKYSTPVFTLADAYGRAGTGKQVSSFIETVTDVLAAFRPGAGVLLRYSEPVLTSEQTFFRAGTGAQVQRFIDVVTDVFAAFRAGTSVPLQYTTPVFTLEQACGRAGVGAQVSRFIDAATDTLPLLRAGTGAQFGRAIEVATDVFAAYRPGAGAQIVSRDTSFNTNSALVRGAAGLRLDDTVAVAVSGNDALVRQDPNKQIQGRGFSYTDTTGAKVRQAPSMFVTGESSSYTNTKEADVVKKPSAPLQGRGRSETDTSGARVRDQRSAQVQADGKSSTENARGILRRADAPKISAHGLSAVSHQSGIAVGTPIEPVPYGANTREIAAVDSRSGSAAAACTTIKTTSTKISFMSGEDVECQFAPAIIKTSHTQLAMSADSECAAVSAEPQSVKSFHKALNAEVRKVGAVEVDPYGISVKETKPQSAAGKAGVAQPVVPSIWLSYRQPGIIGGIPVDAGIVPDRFPIAERCSANRAKGIDSACCGRSTMKNRASVDLVQPDCWSGSGTASTAEKATVDFVVSAAVQVGDKSKSKHSVTLGTAWYPPEWQKDGALLIRQVHNAEMDGNVLELFPPNVRVASRQITTTKNRGAAANGVWVGLESSKFATKQTATLDVWRMPVWQEDGALLIKQAYAVDAETMEVK